MNQQTETPVVKTFPFGLWNPTPVKERIDRWATSGQATSIPLLPQDYLKIDVEAIEAKYNLPVKILGGQQALIDYLKSDDEVEDEG